MRILREAASPPAPRACLLHPTAAGDPSDGRCVWNAEPDQLVLRPERTIHQENVRALENGLTLARSARALERRTASCSSVSRSQADVIPWLGRSRRGEKGGALPWTASPRARHPEPRSRSPGLARSRSVASRRHNNAENRKDRVLLGQLRVYTVGAPDLEWFAFSQREQPERVIELRVHEHDGNDCAVT